MENHHRPRHALGSAAAFRPSAKQFALHPLEKALMLTVMALLIYLPWALGGMRPSAQIVAGILAVVAFVLSLIPRTYDDRYHAGGNLRLYMWPKLRRFPIFWIGSDDVGGAVACNHEVGGRRAEVRRQRADGGGRSQAAGVGCYWGAGGHGVGCGRRRVKFNSK